MSAEDESSPQEPGAERQESEFGRTESQPPEFGRTESQPSEFNPLQQNPLTWHAEQSRPADSQSAPSHPYLAQPGEDGDLLAALPVDEAEAEKRRQPMPRFARVIVVLIGLFVVETVVGVVILPFLWPSLQGSELLSGNAILALFTASAFLGTPLIILMTWLMRREMDHRDLAGMGWRGLSMGRLLLVPCGLLLGAAPIALTAAVVIAIGRFQVQPGGATATFYWLIPILILAALKEEVIFRGYIMQMYWDDAKPIRGVLVSSVLFWLVHLLNPHAVSNIWVMVNLFLAGMFLALAYALSKDLYFPTAVHFAWNFAQGPLLGIPVSGIEVPGLVTLRPVGESWINGGKFGLEASAFAAMIVGIFVLALYLLCDQLMEPPPEDSGSGDSGSGDSGSGDSIQPTAAESAEVSNQAEAG